MCVRVCVWCCITRVLDSAGVSHRFCPRSSCSSTLCPRSTAARPSRRSTEPHTPRTSASARWRSRPPSSEALCFSQSLYRSAPVGSVLKLLILLTITCLEAVYPLSASHSSQRLLALYHRVFSCLSDCVCMLQESRKKSGINSIMRLIRDSYCFRLLVLMED